MRPSSRSVRLRVEPLEVRVVPVAGNMLVTNAENLQCYSPTGKMLWSHPVSAPIGSDDPARDLIVDGLTADIRTHVFNGSTFPFVSSTIDDGENWTDTAGPVGWSTDTANPTGGIAVFTNYLFATDMDISADGNGIIRWDLTDNSSERVVTGTDYIDLTIGLNGKLYALTPSGGGPQAIHVYDPLTLDSFDTINLPAEPNFTGIAVNKNGAIFAVSWNTPDLYMFSKTGEMLRHRRLEGGQLNNLLDIDISDDGKLLIGNEKGYMVRLAVSNFTGSGGSTLAKRNYKVIQIKEPNGTDPSDGPTFVSWADPQEITLPHVTITGKKYDDLNTNGVRNTGEPGLEGWTIFADLNENGTPDTGEPFALTDELGNYSLDVNLNASTTFRLKEQPLLGWAQVFDPTATADEPTFDHPYYTLTFTDGDQSHVNFGNHTTGVLVTTEGDLKTSETGGTATFTVVLTAPCTSDVTIPITSLDLTEGTVATPLTFTPLNWNAPQIVTVTGQPEPGYDGNVVYTIEVGPTDSTDLNYENLPTQTVSVTNFDSEPVVKVGIARDLPRRWRLDAFNDGVYTPGLDRSYTKLGAGRTIVGDWNGDGYDDLGLFRGDIGTFRLFVDGTLFKTVKLLDGRTGGTPLVGDWNGVVGDEVGLFREDSGSFRLDVDNDGLTNDADDLRGNRLDGKTGGRPLVGDWNGAGGEEIGLYRPENGVFTLDTDGDLATSDPDDTVIQQLAGRIEGRAIVGDWDGDGDDNVGLFFGLSGKWFLDTNNDATSAEKIFTRIDGLAGGAPIVGDFNGDGITDCGIFRSTSGKWTIDLNGNGVYDAGIDLLYRKVDGTTGGRPLVGKWELP